MSADKTREQFESAYPNASSSFTGEVMQKIMFEVWRACAKIKDAEIAELNARVAMLRNALQEAMYSNSTSVSSMKADVALTTTEADVTTFINGIKAERDAEWMSKPVVNMGVAFFPWERIPEIGETLYAKPKDIK